MNAAPTLHLQAPLAGWVLPLSAVPDPVFAERMAGDGVAIDPTSSILHAPCDGEIVPMHGAKHALSLRTAQGLVILLHVGVETVALRGEGFELLVAPDERVSAGQALLRFDLDVIARRARSAVTPILLASAGTIKRRSEQRAIEVGDFLMEIAIASEPTPAQAHAADAIAQRFRVAFEHGLHARPAALIASTLRAFDAAVSVGFAGRNANARSTTALMALGVHCGDVIEVKAAGTAAAEAMRALETLLGTVTPSAPVTVSAAPTPPARSDKNHPDRIEGVIACRGLAVGVAVQMQQPNLPVAESGVSYEFETQQLAEAIAAVKQHLETLACSAAGEQKTILAAHIELLQDPDLARQARDWLRCGKSAAYAWRSVVRASAQALQALDDPHLQERVADLRDLEQQVLGVLGGQAPDSAMRLPERAILLADELLPSQLVALERTRIVGICTARGGPTSHVAIIAAAMGIPALVAAGDDVLAIAEGTPLILDAEHGRLRVNPAPAERAAVERVIVAAAQAHAADLAAAQHSCATTDGVPIAVYANLGALAEVEPAIAFGAEGCGLLRTEFLFLDRRQPPDEAEQARAYQEFATALGERTLTIRTLDIGGDKPIAYLPLPREDNPALGLRGLRTSLWRPELLRTQLRAILRVQPLAHCRILLPMVIETDEVRIVRALLSELCAKLGRARMPSVGVMIETPASALLADQLLREVDFLSIGSNDLSQYTLAMDRGHAELAAKLDALHPAVLRLIAHAADAGTAAGVEVAVCGGLASDLSAIPILIGLGVREISVVPAAIPRIKRSIRTLDAAQCRALAREALAQPSAAAVRAMIERALASTQRGAATNAISGG